MTEPTRSRTQPNGDRLGFGAMRITGEGIGGRPGPTNVARPEARRRARSHLIDTADSYGPYVSEELIRERSTLRQVKIATKAGFLRIGPTRGASAVARLPTSGVRDVASSPGPGVDRPLQLHRIDLLSRRGSIRTARDLLDEASAGVGLSEVSVEQIVAEEGRPDLDGTEPLQRDESTERSVLEYCAGEGIGFIPGSPCAGSLARSGGPLDALANKNGITSDTLARVVAAPSPVLLRFRDLQGGPRGGELRRAAVTLDDETFDALDALRD